MTEVQIECVVESGDYLGESPIWCDRTQTLYWINCEYEPSLLNFNPATGTVQSWQMPCRIGAIALREDDSLQIALADGIYLFDKASGALNLIASNPDTDTVLLHEGKCDRQGRFWIGGLAARMRSHGEMGGAHFYRLDGDGLHAMVDDISVANGLAFSPDGTTLYHTDTPAQTVWAYDYDISNGSISNRRVFVTIAPEDGGPDGATVDAEGGYWITLFKGSCIRRYLPDGTLDRQVSVPVTQPTMMAFGGPDMTDMYLTSTRHGLRAGQPIEGPGLGHVFRLRGLGKGIAESRIKS